MDFSTLQFSDFVRLAPIIFEKGKQLLPLEARQSGLFNVTPIPLNTGNTREFSDSVDTGQYSRRKAEGEQAAHARIKQGYKKIMYYGRIGLDLTITHEAMTLNKYPEIVRGLTSLGMHDNNRIELDLQHRIGFGTSTSMTNMDGETVDLTLGDGLALFSAVHTLTGSSVTYRNRLSGDPQFSRGANEAPRSKLRGIGRMMKSSEQIELLIMQLLVLFLPTLLLYIFAYHLLVPVLSYRAYVITVCPEFPSPQLLLYFWASRKYLSRRYAFYDLHDLLRTVHRNTLNQKMHVIFICPYFQKRYLVPLADPETNLFEFLVYFRTKDNSSVLRWADDVIQKYRNIMTLVNEATHSHSILSQQAAGN